MMKRSVSQDDVGYNSELCHQPELATFSRAASVAHKIGLPMFADSSSSLAASPAIRELECTIVETTIFAIPVLPSAKTPV